MKPDLNRLARDSRHCAARAHHQHCVFAGLLICALLAANASAHDGAAAGSSPDANAASATNRIVLREALQLTPANSSVAAQLPNRRPELAVQAIQETSRGPFDSSSADPSYRLGENDVVTITVYQEPDLDVPRARIARDGSISFPLLGTVRIGGKNVREATAHVRELLSEDYLVDPQVNLALVEYSRRQFTVLGEVQRPGTFPIPDDRPLTLQQAIGMAGGFKPGAKQSRITVTRMVGNDKVIQKVDAAAFARDRRAKPFVILPDDHILVPEKFW